MECDGYSRYSTYHLLAQTFARMLFYMKSLDLLMGNYHTLKS